MKKAANAKKGALGVKKKRVMKTDAKIREELKMPGVWLGKRTN